MDKELKLKMQGAQEMLQAIKERTYKFYFENGKDADVYQQAIEELISANIENTALFLQGRPIGYCDHKTAENGKLESVRAYFL